MLFVNAPAKTGQFNIVHLKVCTSWNIPFLSLDGINPGEISKMIEDMDPKPRVLLSTISRMGEESVQAAIRRLPVRHICIDEVQVSDSLIHTLYCPKRLGH